jgi:hypothetical protein
MSALGPKAFDATGAMERRILGTLRLASGEWIICMNEVELFKELCTYERHFNQMQNVCRGFASTWLLAVFGGFGYIIANKTPGILDWQISGSLVALSGVTGIFLLWVLDVLVYHNLLLVVIDARSGMPKLDFTKKTVVPLFGKLPKAMLPSVRYAISLFYGIPGTFLFFVALGLNIVTTIKGAGPGSVICAVWVWLVLASLPVLFMMTTTR